MRRNDQMQGSTLGLSVTVRFTTGLFDRVRDHLLADPHNEQFAFVLMAQSKTADGTVFIAKDLFLPDRKDLASQSAGGVSPTKRFQQFVYFAAQQRGLSIFDVHTHPHDGVPTFSGTDETHAFRNARYIRDRFPDPITHGMIVFGRDVTGHDAVVYDRTHDAFRTMTRIEILGDRLEIRQTGRQPSSDETDAQFARQALIPGWEQQQLAQQRVAIVGAGGNGSQIFQTLLSLGIGSEEWLAIIDPDIVEQSNLPRIPYSYPDCCGEAKVDVAARCAARKAPKARVLPYKSSVTDPGVQRRIKGATLLIGAADNDGVRAVLNELSVRYLIPYIDLGCDLQFEGDRIVAGGQVRVVIPGLNACMVCCRGYDPAEAALDLMDPVHAAEHAARGYVRGSDADATPSVVTLNAITAQLGVTAALSLMLAGPFGRWHYAHFDQTQGRLLTASTKRREDCPECGRYGNLAAGDSESDDHNAPQAGSGGENVKQDPDQTSMTSSPALGESVTDGASN